LESIVYRLSALSYFSQFSGPENESRKAQEDLIKKESCGGFLKICRRNSILIFDFCGF